MSTWPPRRPLTALPPPPDGLQSALAEARRRRRTRATRAGTALAAAVAATAVTTAFALPGQRHRPAGPDVLAPVPAATAPASSGTEPSRQPGQANTPPPGPPARSAAATPGAHPPHQPPPTAASHPASWQPHLTRQQRPAPGNGTQLCTGSTYGNGAGQVDNGFGWCLQAAADHDANGVRLGLWACRDSTSGGTLSFDGSREVDLLVRDSSGATVWDYASARPEGPQPHQLTAGASTCWVWQLDWPVIRQDGTAAPRGQFTLDATSTAREVAGHPTASINFTA